MSKTPPLPLPPGWEQVAAWARARGLSFQQHPDPSWFQRWEPFDTMTSPEAYFSAVSWSVRRATFTVAEPWMAPVGSEPLDRTLLTFVSHPGFVRRAAARAGEHFNTRVTYLESPPPPTVQIGDPAWDTRAQTLAASPGEAAAALPPGARQLLLDWKWTGHVEVRPGGVVLHLAGFRAIPEHLDRVLNGAADLTARLLAG